MHILIAPNAFKNSLNADAAASAIREGFLQSKIDCTCECFPIGDGGDGTGDLIIKKCNGVLVYTDVAGPLGKTVNASFGLIDDGKTAIIEMANASGLRLLQRDELNPLRALSVGTGEQMKAALDKGVTKIIIGMGGSATVDGGAGILKALGIEFLDAGGRPLQGLPESLTELSSIDIKGLDKRIQRCEVIVLCDVDNILLGEQGAPAVFGPQKGASPAMVGQLDAALAKFNEITWKQTGVDMSVIRHGGTAGGAAAGLFGFLNARLVNGIDYFLELTGFNKALEQADIVITGEGSIDEQTLQGKGPFGVAHRAKQKNLPVICLAGRVPLQINASLQKYFDALIPIGNEPAELATAFRLTAENMIRTSCAIGNLLSLKQSSF